MAENKQYITKADQNGVIMISEDVVSTIVGRALEEVEGVAGLAKRPIQLRNIKSLMSASRTSHSKSVGFSTDNGAIILDIFVTVRDNVKVKDVAEAVQLNVKDKVQSMTGNAVANVNVHIDDLLISEE